MLAPDTVISDIRRIVLTVLPLVFPDSAALLVADAAATLLGELIGRYLAGEKLEDLQKEATRRAALFDLTALQARLLKEADDPP